MKRSDNFLVKKQVENRGFVHNLTPSTEMRISNFMAVAKLIASLLQFDIFHSRSTICLSTQM